MRTGGGHAEKSGQLTERPIERLKTFYLKIDGIPVAGERQSCSFIIFVTSNGLKCSDAAA